LFVIDVSSAAVAAGVLECVSASIRSTLDKLPGDQRTMVPALTLIVRFLCLIFVLDFFLFL
jgi:hypothetical protein